jgi:anti-anti-sigma regulatory factor
MYSITTDPAAGVVALSGAIAAGDVAALRLALVAAVDAIDTDLILDARAVTAFDEACLPALVAARSRAKWRRRFVAVIGTLGDPIEIVLRRTAPRSAFPVVADLAVARGALAEFRAGRAVSFRERVSLASNGSAPPNVANPFRQIVQ